MSWGAGCPVDIRLAPTVAERRTFGCTDHNECLQSYCRKVSCEARKIKASQILHKKNSTHLLTVLIIGVILQLEQEGRA